MRAQTGMAESADTAGEGSSTVAAAEAAAEATAAAAAPADACAGVFVTCERDRVRKWLADDGGDVEERLPAVTLAGFNAYVAEDWLFDAHFPCVVVVATNDPRDTVCFLCLLSRNHSVPLLTRHTHTHTDPRVPGVDGCHCAGTQDRRRRVLWCPRQRLLDPQRLPPSSSLTRTTFTPTLTRHDPRHQAGRSR